MRFGGRLLGAAVATFAVSAAAADPVPSLDLRGFHPPTDPAGFLYLEPASTPGAGNWNIGAYASYALAPVVLKNPSDHVVGRVVQHQLSIDYFGSVGVGKTWSFGVTVPTVVYQSGNDVSALLPGSTELPHTAVGAIALDAKKVLVPPSELGGLGISALGRVYVPTSSTSYVSDHSPSAEARLLGELDLLAVAVRATAGVFVRGDEETFLRDGTDNYLFGSNLPWGVGATVRPQALGFDRGGHWRWTAEVHGALALNPSFAAAPQSPVLGALSARYTAKDVSALFGVELPLNEAIGNPTVRPVIAIGWAPRFEDADGDGIEDDKDQCPELPEDKDGFEDGDGCPDYDNDDDGVPDADDKCPTLKEDADGFQDDDGCPDPDNDGDGIPDTADKCPNEKGPPTGPHAGCPDPDPDHDGIPKDKDRCPDLAEDKDGFQDGDGCPDLDNDRDGIPDTADACPNLKGEPNTAPELNGCPNLDHDGDTFDDAVDKCPKEPEDFDGIDDDDGCPDAKTGKTAPPLVTVTEDPSTKAPLVKLRIPPRFIKDEVDPKTLPTLRGLAIELNLHPTWIAAVGVRPLAKTAKAEQAALNHAFVIVQHLRTFTHRDKAAESMGWGAVRTQPGADSSGIGVLVMTPETAVKATP